MRSIVLLLFFIVSTVPSFPSKFLLEPGVLASDSTNDFSTEKKQLENCFQWSAEQKLVSQPIGVAVAELGKYFLGTLYEAGTLEHNTDESLVVYFSGLDCTTLVENVLCLARLVKKHKTTFEDFKNELTLIRYRNGKINKYPSRLHYFSDWIYNNVKKGLVKDITESLGGEKIMFDLNFMSTHPDAYKHLKQNPEFIPIIRGQENEISKRDYYYIPSDKVKELESKLQDGDIIAFTTSIKGLDISHVGIAVVQPDKRMHILHAPVPGSKVQITDAALGDYIKKIKKDTGIIVLRPVEP